MAFRQPSNPNIGSNQPAKIENYDIHTMPQKFHSQLAVKPAGSMSKLLMVLGVVLALLVILGIGAYFIYLQMNKQAQQANQTANLNVANVNVGPENLNTFVLNANENANLNENINAAANENANLNENTNLPAVNANENLNLNANLNENANLNANANINAPVGLITYASSLDSDNDKLTDVEEDLYGTEKRAADTDGDGYLDGDEIINGYNPKMAGGAKLETSGLVNKYSNPLFNYDILYPTSWLAKPEDQSLRSVLFVTGTEEFMKVEVIDNPNKSDIVSWYTQQSPGADLNLLSKVTTQFTGLKKYEALVSPDKLTYYILDPNTQDKVYVISYNIGALKEINFLSTFQMMVNSFSVKATAP